MTRGKHHAPVEPIDSEPLAVSAEKPDTNRLRITSRVLLGAAGLALAGGIIAGTNHEKNTEFFDSFGFIPTPSVSPAGAEALIATNDALRDFGPYGLGIGAAAGIVYVNERRRRDGQLAAMHDLTHKSSRMPRVMLTGVMMGIVASASGMGDTASNGANAPIEAMADMLGADAAATPLITSYANAPYNPSAIDYPRVRDIITEAGGTAVPFMQILGEVKDPTSEGNPSSAPIFAVPNEVLKKSLGVNLPEVENCDDISLIVGEQLGVEAGGAVTINDKPATVVDTVKIKPGLDRVAAIGSLEQMTKCVFPEDQMTGAIALGLDGRQEEIQQKIRDSLQVDYVARSFEEFQEEYDEFWDHSVKPPEMMLILSSAALGGIALGALQINEIRQRRKTIAMLLSQGNKKGDISKAYMIATQKDTLLAAPFAAATSAPLFTALNNSSQYGIAEAMNLSSIGAGYAVFAGITGVASVFANRVIKKIDTAAELRSGV
jgi:hypothetical protein